MAARPELVRYLHGCFVADHRTGGVTDLFARRIEHRHFFTGDDELIGGAVQPIGVPRDPLDPIARAAAVYAERIAKLPGAVAERHRLLLGTPYAFQGQERDVMLISWVLDPEAAGGAFRYLDRSDVFNVAITRARSVQHVFCSLEPGHAPAGHLLRRYLEDTLAGAVPEPPAPAADAFLRDVRDALAAYGLGCWPSYTVAGFTVDLVVSDGRASLGIDLVGHPGAFADAVDLERCRMLLRAGLPVFPLPLSAWRHDWQGAVAAILDRLAQVRRSAGGGRTGC